MNDYRSVKIATLDGIHHVALKLLDARAAMRKPRMKSDSTRVLDYSANAMSAYEIESLAAEATLREKKATTRKKKTARKTTKRL